MNYTNEFRTQNCIMQARYLYIYIYILAVSHYINGLPASAFLLFSW